jgi:hypothetical protein
MSHAPTAASIDIAHVPAQLHAQMTSQMPRLLEENVEFDKALPGLLASVESEKYVEVVANWWGLVFVLSDQAAKDLSSGSGGLAAVVGAIAAACAAIPGVNIAVGVVAAVLGLHAVVIGAMNRGKGVYVTALWTVVLIPTLWIPTPRT